MYELYIFKRFVNENRYIPYNIMILYEDIYILTVRCMYATYLLD